MDAPWWVASAAAVVGSLGAAAGRVWSEQRSEIKQLRADLAAANARNVELQREEHGEHVRDLRRFAGLSTSLEPPASSAPVVPRPRPKR